jgi:hypothetical protein
MQLDTNVMQSRTAANLVEFINKQNDVIAVLRNELDAFALDIDAKVLTACQDTLHDTKLINAKRESALAQIKERRKGGRTPERRSNGRIKF